MLFCCSSEPLGFRQWFGMGFGLSLMLLWCSTAPLDVDFGITTWKDFGLILMVFWCSAAPFECKYSCGWISDSFWCYCDIAQHHSSLNVYLDGFWAHSVVALMQRGAARVWSFISKDLGLSLMLVWCNAATLDIKHLFIWTLSSFWCCCDAAQHHSSLHNNLVGLRTQFEIVMTQRSATRV